jgi:hypothetical protein
MISGTTGFDVAMHIGHTEKENEVFLIDDVHYARAFDCSVPLCLRIRRLFSRLTASNRSGAAKIESIRLFVIQGDTRDTKFQNPDFFWPICGLQFGQHTQSDHSSAPSTAGSKSCRTPPAVVYGTSLLKLTTIVLLGRALRESEQYMSASFKAESVSALSDTWPSASLPERHPCRRLPVNQPRHAETEVVFKLQRNPPTFANFKPSNV